MSGTYSSLQMTMMDERADFFIVFTRFELTAAPMMYSG
jgi:hypothetical protein